MKVEIWSDIVCPFCYIGKRKFEDALKDFDDKDDVEVMWRSFQLDPGMMPVPGKSLDQYLADRKGIPVEKGKQMNEHMSRVAKDVGLTFNFDTAIINNTMNAHRLLHLASKYGVQNLMKEKLFAAYFTEGKDIGDVETVVQLAESAGLDAVEARTMLQGNEFVKEVQLDQHRAQQMGANGVPFFVFNDKYAVSGAQPSELFVRVLNKVREEEELLAMEAAPGDFCTPDGICN